MEDTPIFREVAEASAASCCPARPVAAPGGRHHWRDVEQDATDPYGDVPEPRR